MSRATGDASTALAASIVKPVYFAYLDFDGDPVRANSSGADMAITGTGDADMDGFTFLGLSAAFTDISSIKAARGGSDTVTARLSGIPDLDPVMDLIGDRSKWQGRVARLWRMVRNSSNVQQGAIIPYYTGYMTAAAIEAEPDSQSVVVTIESYLAAFTKASNRSYLDQSRYDAGDLSARAAIAIANGNTGNPVTGGTPVGGGGGRSPGFTNDQQIHFV